MFYMKQPHERYMASDPRCPISYIFKLAVEVDGAAAPKGSMTYDSTQGSFLRVLQFPSSDQEPLSCLYSTVQVIH